MGILLEKTKRRYRDRENYNTCRVAYLFVKRYKEDLFLLII